MKKPTRNRDRDAPSRGNFTVVEIEQMVETGLLHPDERLELIGGELVHMAPKGIAHETLKSLLLEQWFAAKPKNIMIMPETTFRLNERTFLEPDILILDKSVGFDGLRGEQALLIVEIAETSFSYDTTVKAATYAYFRVPELWVIDALHKVVRVHRRPSGPSKTPAIYESVRDLSVNDSAVSLAVPELKLCLSKISAAA